LYNLFQKHTHTKETFDEFYFWGEILLSDFSDIDRYLVDAGDLFKNISDIKEIESQFDYLTDEQKKALEHFWGSIVGGSSKGFQKKYVTIWEKLFSVYSDFKKELAAQKVAYSGMIHRSVIERLEIRPVELNFSKYYIIGLNALNSCEKRFFNFLKREQKAEFLWDFDNSYLEDAKNEAGKFMRENLKLYPPPSDFIFDAKSFNRSKNIKLAAVSWVYGQVQAIPGFLSENTADIRNNFDNTAIVLADESLLFAALGAIPNDVEKVNVTMGYPVKNSVVFGFLTLLVSLVKNSRSDSEGKKIACHRFVTDILNHQLLAGIESEKVKKFVAAIKLKNTITIRLNDLDFSPIHRLIFSLPVGVETYSDYFLTVLSFIFNWLKENDSANSMLEELIYAIYQAIEKLKTVVSRVVSGQNKQISDTVYFRLFSQYIGQVSVAFQGEPLSGLQVMGILETRCLDFENLVILGLNENKWPRTFTAPSFIPYNIRKGFGLPGIDEQDAMYSYYFYRLIQRSKNVTATYSVVKEGIGTGELSRYGQQLRYDSVQKPQLVNLDFSFGNSPVRPISIKSSEQIISKLLNQNSKEHPLSPSALNTYLQCSLRFYFRYVARLPEPEEVKEEIDGVIFGNIFHEAIEKLYRSLEGREIQKSDLTKIRKNHLLINGEIKKSIAHNYFREKNQDLFNMKLQGKTRLIFENTKTFIDQLIKTDIEFAPFQLIDLEKNYNTKLKLPESSLAPEIYIGGQIDRVDRVNGNLRVLDYKTGNVDKLSFTTVDELFERGVKNPKKEILQALIYSFILSENKNDNKINSTIYSLRKLFGESKSPYICRGSSEVLFSDIKDEFKLLLTNLVEEIYSPGTIFYQTTHTDKCSYCPYKTICQRF
ncbi:MAG: PD-(D/E)XK nuclease family protein, partial [Prolixibacteraceae bacterium]|nr:PD-(D/E)XK nuclease family protein [Prolixibacteraceae bacterium]